MEPHNRIINDTAKKYLSPEGLFRKGTSRIWLEDNGFFMTVIEFQPSSYDKGTYLNTGIDFLWDRANYDSLVFGYGERVFVGKGKQYASYKEGHEDKFIKEVEEFAEAALEKVREYRRFINTAYTKERLLSYVKNPRYGYDKPYFWDIFDLSMICFFMGDFIDGSKYFDGFLSIAKNSFYRNNVHIDWIENFYNHCIETIVPHINNSDEAQRMIFDMINRRRAFFNAKSSFKKMRKDIIY